MFSTTSTLNVSLTARADIVRALHSEDLAVTAELREIGLLERAGELTPYQAQLLCDSAQTTGAARTARWTTVHHTGAVTTFDLEVWHGRRDAEVLAIRRDLAANGLL